MAPKAVLVGMPGSGKSTIGRRLAKAMGLPLLDTDAAIVEETGRSIADIFADDGEQEFRRIEEDVVKKALAGHDGIVSLGGGAVTSPGVRDALAGHTVVYLEISAAEGVRRTAGGGRPLLAGDDPGAKYRELMAQRVPLFRQVDVVINVESSHAYGSVTSFFAEVKRVLRPGGYFLITDMRDPKNLAGFEQMLLASGLSPVAQKVISPNVVKAIELEDDSKRARIRRQVPARYVKFFEEFGGVKNSQIDKDLRSGDLVYFWYVMKK